jgi:hypothetical protein
VARLARKSLGPMNRSSRKFAIGRFLTSGNPCRLNRSMQHHLI